MLVELIEVSMNIRSYTFGEYVERVRSFHGFAAPGVLIGGFMVDLAYQHLPEEGRFDAICETAKCLPDAIQLLTPCTIGNGWLRVIDMRRFALSFYDKSNGEGIRVFLDPALLEAWPKIKNWFFKLKPKKEQDHGLLMGQIRKSGTSICSIERVRVAPCFLEKKHRGKIALCPQCKEAYPLADGPVCLSCAGKTLYWVSEIADGLAPKRREGQTLLDIPG